MIKILPVPFLLCTVASFCWCYFVKGIVKEQKIKIIGLTRNEQQHIKRTL